MTDDTQRRALAPDEQATAKVAEIGVTPVKAGGAVAVPAELPAALRSRFEKIEILGQGGAGVVMRARDRMIGREVAIKLLIDGGGDHKQLLRGEATHLAQLEHERVVRLYEFGEADAQPYLVMEYVRGDTLWKRLACDRPPLLEALAIGVDLADGLAAAHALSVAHGDVKPMNVFLDRAGRVKIADFGLARRVSELDDSGTKGAQVLGTPGYLAPEQADGQPITAASDVYAAGVVLHEMLTGQRLFTGRTPLAILTMQARGPEYPPSSLNPGVPGGLDELVMRCLDARPERRPAARELADALRGWQDRLVRAARQPATAGFPPQPYKFLDHFEAEDAVIFFGRESEVAELVGLVTSSALRMLLVFAPCGTGKSSLLRAGLVPALDRGAWDSLLMTAGADPAAALVDALEKRAAALSGPAPLPGTELARAREALAWIGKSGRTPVLVVDQLEELFTLNAADDPAIARFFELASGLVEAQDQPLRLVLAFRTEFRGRLFALERRLAKHTRSYLVGEMGEMGLAAAIEGPSAIASYGFGYEPGFVRTLAGDIRQTLKKSGETAPPVMQIVCRQLYEHAKREDVKVIGPALYQKALGGARGALTRYVEERLEGPGYGAHAGLAHQMLRALTVRESGGERFARAREEDDLLAFPDRAAARRVLDQLIADRLVVREESRRGFMIRLASEIICPLVDRWAEDVDEAERAARLLGRAARQWTENGRRDEDLLTGGALKMVERQLSTLRSLTPDELALVGASRGARRVKRAGVAAALACAAAIVGGALWAAFLRPGRAAIQSDPPGAQVVDASGRALGTTPFTWDASPGVYQLTLRRARYRDLALTVRVPAGGEATYAPVLAYPYGVLTLASEPAGATCAVVDSAGQTVLTTGTPFHAELPTGQYTLKLAGPGVVAQVLAGVSVGANREAVERMVRLERDTGWLQVDTADAGAEMTVRERDTGRVVITSTLPMAPREIASGHYELDVQMPDRHAQIMSVAVTRQTTSLVSASPSPVKALWNRAPMRPFGMVRGMDADGDGAPDLVVLDADIRFRMVSGRTGQNIWTSGEPPAAMVDGQLQTWGQIVGREGVETIQLADIDGDGKADAVLALDSGRVLGLDPHTGRIKVNLHCAARRITWGPLVRDLDGKPGDEIVALVGEKLAAFSGQSGQEIWSVPAKPTAVHFALVDRALPGRPLAVILDADGSIQARDANDGAIVWTWDAKSDETMGEVHVAVADLDGDGKPDVAATGPHGVVVLDAVSGHVKWEDRTLRAMSVVTGRLVKGAGRQVVVGAHDRMVAYDGATGKALWTKRHAVWFDDLAVADLDRDGLDDVIAKRRSNRVEIYRGCDGRMLWSHANAPDIRYEPALFDLDGDGAPDLIYMDQQKGLVAVSSAVPAARWSFKVSGTIVPSPAAGDLDGDGVPDVVACVNGDTGSWLVAVSGKDAHALWQAPYPPRAFPYTIGNPCLVLADLDGDGKPDAVVVDDHNRVHAHEGRTGRELWSRPDLVGTIGPQGIDTGKAKAVLLRALDRKRPESMQRLTALDGKTGATLWETEELPPCGPASPAFREKGRARPDVLTLLATPRKGLPMMAVRGAQVAVIDAVDGTVRRTLGAAFPLEGPPSLASADVNGDGVDDALVMQGRAKLTVLDGKTGAVLWTAPAPDTRTPPGMEPIEDQLGTADIDGDGVPDAVVVGLAGHAVALSGKTGKPIWDVEMHQRTQSRMTLALTAGTVPDIILNAFALDVVFLDGKTGKVRNSSINGTAQVAGIPVDPADGPVHGEIEGRRVDPGRTLAPGMKLLVSGRDAVLRLLPPEDLPRSPSQ